MTAIHSTDDLKTATREEIEAARNSLRIRERVIARVESMGSQLGMTREEYLEHLASLEEHDCPTCKGTGRVKPPKPREQGVIHPSSAHTCTLRLYHDVVGSIAPRENIPWRLRVTFNIGHAIHDTIQQALLDELGPSAFIPEKKIDIGGLVRGNTDGELWLPEAHAVLEIKTAGDSTFDGLSAPKKDHLIQAMGLYATALDAPFVVFLYVSKTYPYPVKEFVLEYDESIFSSWFRSKGGKVAEALRSGQPPVADATAYECSECPYGHSCMQKITKNGGTFRRTR